MDLQTNAGGRQHFSLGPVEKWIAVVIAGCVVATGTWQVRSTQTLIVQAAVTNEQLRTLNLQMSDVPSLKLEIAKQAVKIDQNTKDITELRSMKGLR